MEQRPGFRGLPWILMGAMLLALSMSHMASQFLRSSVGVIVPNLRAELDLSPEQIGILGGAFYLAFAAAQLPIGVFLDRYRARRVMAGSILFAVLGTLLFAVSQSLPMLVLARVLMGLGCSCLLMGPIYVFVHWLPSDRLATFTGILVALGGLGTLVATSPLAYATITLGWRSSFFAATAFVLATFVFIVFFVKDHPPDQERRTASKETMRDSLRGVLEILRHPQTPFLFAIQFSGYAVFICILGLWGAPYLTGVHGASVTTSGWILFAMAISVMIGQVAWGPMDRLLNSRKLPITVGALSVSACLATLALWPSPPLFAVSTIFVLLAFFTGYTPIALVQGRSVYPIHLVGRGMTVLNTGVMLGVFFYQIATGTIIGFFEVDQSTRPETGFRAVFGFLSVSLLATVLFYRRAIDTPPMEQAARP